MRTYRLPSGREVTLVRFNLAGTYSGHLEGTRTTVSDLIRNRLPEEARGVLSPAQPLAIVPIPAGELPQWFCVAELKSYGGVKHKDPIYESYLYTCWFTDDTSKSIDQMVETLLPHLDWEGIAEDFNAMDF